MRSRMEAAARQIRFGTSLQLPNVRVPARVIEHLTAGQILRLDLPATTAPVWCVGGQPLATAYPLRRGDHRAARLESRLQGGGS
jgi:flagellar motor switch protein FliM